MKFKAWGAGIQCNINEGSISEGGPEHVDFGSSTVLYSGKYSWGPNFILFVLSLSEQKFNTQDVRYDGRVFLCKMDRTKIKHTNQLEIAQNEIWTPRKLPTIR